MSRLIIRLFALAIFFSPAIAFAQGVLIVTDPDQQVRLPRPIIIYPPRPWPPPHPMPIPRQNLP